MEEESGQERRGDSCMSSAPLVLVSENLVLRAASDLY